MRGAVAGVACAVLAGCEGDRLTAAEYGARIAADPSLGGSANPFACTTCHATDDGDDRMLPGHALSDSAYRDAYWGGTILAPLEAVNFCVQFFMAGPALAADSREARALYAYMERLSPVRPAPTLPLTIVENVTDVGRGSAARGEVVYERACRACHGAAHTGSGRIAHPGLFEADIVLPQWTRTYPTDFPGVDPALVVIEKVRHGQFFGIGGNMPLFAREMLRDEDLGALLSYLDL